MHGRLKVRTTEEQKAIKFKEQQAKLKAYRTGLNEIISQRKQGICDQNTLNLIAKIITTNPDIYTLWNIRKEILLAEAEPCEKKQIKQEAVENELSLTEQCLRVNPKSYCAWYHRCWVLENCPEPDWKKEVLLCNKYLKFDDRNFHCWDYRRFVVSHTDLTSENELEYTTELINVNFSNYSSWHYRSILYKSLSPSDKAYENELNLVQAAAFTDPSDTSAWFYQRWLLGHTSQNLELISGIVENKRIVISFNKACGNDITLQLNINSNIIPTDWVLYNDNSKHSYVWSTQIPDDLTVTMNDTVKLVVIDKEVEISNLILKWENETRAVCGPKHKLGKIFSDNVRSVLKEQLSSCEELLKLEPNSKWTLLTAILFMRGLGGKEYEEKSLEYLEDLKKYDPMHIEYYNDLRSRWLIEEYINQRIESNSYFDDVSLNDLNLTALYYMQYFSSIRTVDLSNNKITNRSIKQLSNLVCCEKLSLNNNNISEVKHFPMLPNIVHLEMKDNDFNLDEEIIKIRDTVKNIIL